MLNDHLNLLGSDRTLGMLDHRNVTVHLNPTHRSQFLCTMVGRIFGRSKDPVACGCGVFLTQLTIVRVEIMLDNRAAGRSTSDLGRF